MLLLAYAYRFLFIHRYIVHIEPTLPASCLGNLANGVMTSLVDCGTQ